jgi:hypothetical protein
MVGRLLEEASIVWLRRDAEVEAALAVAQAGSPATLRDPQARRIAELERSSPHLRYQLRQAAQAIAA